MVVPGCSWLFLAVPESSLCLHGTVHFRGGPTARPGAEGGSGPGKRANDRRWWIAAKSVSRVWLGMANLRDMSSIPRIYRSGIYTIVILDIHKYIPLLINVLH